MEGSITTLNELRARQETDHPDWKPGLEDLVYVEHGVGGDRNRTFTLEEVRDLLQDVFETITMTKNGSTFELDGEGGLVSKADKKVKLTSDGIEISNDNAGGNNKSYIKLLNDGSIEFKHVFQNVGEQTWNTSVVTFMHMSGNLWGFTQPIGVNGDVSGTTGTFGTSVTIGGSSGAVLEWASTFLRCTEQLFVVAGLKVSNRGTNYVELMPTTFKYYPPAGAAAKTVWTLTLNDGVLTVDFGTNTIKADNAELGNLKVNDYLTQTKNIHVTAVNLTTQDEPFASFPQKSVLHVLATTGVTVLGENLLAYQGCSFIKYGTSWYALKT